MGKPINVEFFTDYVEFSLTNRKSKYKESYRIKVSHIDYKKFIQGTTCWYLKNETSYKCGTVFYVAMCLYVNGYDKSPKTVFLHREIVSMYEDLPEYNVYGGLEVDHINRIKIDNRRTNLRVVDHIENKRNKDSVINCEQTCRMCNIHKRVRPKSISYQVYFRDTYIGCYKSRELAEQAINNLWDS